MVSGGGTGGHVFPAIAIADAIKALRPAADFLFVGAKGKIEMEKVPAAGYPIVGLWISGFHRQLTVRNLLFPFKLLSSLWRSWRLIRRFRPHVAVGVGGFASGPVLEVASRLGVPTLIQEQNSFAGVTNRLLGGKVNRICVAYDGMERFFPAQKLVLAGNPVRKDLVQPPRSREEGLRHFGFAADKLTLFVFGGSLGAQSLNEAMAANAGLLGEHPDIQVLWQAGKLYYERFRDCETARLPNVEIRTFIDRMDLAYAMADLVICRAGALTIAELAMVGKAALLVPSPNVAEDHQTSNAKALVAKDAAAMLDDREAGENMIRKAIELLADADWRAAMGRNVRQLAKPDAASQIAAEVLKLVKT